MTTSFEWARLPMSNQSKVNPDIDDYINEATTRTWGPYRQPEEAARWYALARKRGWMDRHRQSVMRGWGRPL
jgi:hypothetical protein